MGLEEGCTILILAIPNFWGDKVGTVQEELNSFVQTLPLDKEEWTDDQWRQYIELENKVYYAKALEQDKMIKAASVSTLFSWLEIACSNDYAEDLLREIRSRELTVFEEKQLGTAARIAYDRFY